MKELNMPCVTDDKTQPAKSPCTVCGSADVSVFIDILQVPVHCNVLCSAYEESLQVPRGDIRLTFCKNCCHFFNAAFEPDIMKYDQEYENSLHFSPRFQEYAKSLARRLTDQYDLHNKDIIEIGCGKGDFLMLLCESGENRGIGFDTSYVPGRSDAPGQEQITFIQDFYSPRYANYKADCICCRHVLEHIQFPRKFLENICNTVGDRFKPLVFFEVPNGAFTLEDLGIWDLIYEHCSYFSMTSLKYLFAACGFDIANCAESFEGQFLNIEAFPAELPAETYTVPEKEIERMNHYVEMFKDRYDSTLTKWQHKLKEIRNSGKKAVVWGAGSKGVAFLNVLQIKDQIEYLVDVNPYKQGKYIAGIGKEIVSPDFLKKYRPDTVIVMNPVYLNEIRKMIQQLGLNPEFAVC